MLIAALAAIVDKPYDAPKMRREMVANVDNPTMRHKTETNQQQKKQNFS
jgi:hypothetical protein